MMLATQRRAEANHLDHIAPAHLWHRPPPNAHKPTHDYPDLMSETGDIILKVSLADQRNPDAEAAAPNATKAAPIKYRDRRTTIPGLRQSGQGRQHNRTVP